MPMVAGKPTRAAARVHGPLGPRPPALLAKLAPTRRVHLRGHHRRPAMSRFIALACLSAAAVAGCGHTTYRETVVEKQPVVTRETIVERPVTPTVVPSQTVVAVPSTVAAPGGACGLGSQAYAQGTMSCISGYQYQ